MYNPTYQQTNTSLPVREQQVTRNQQKSFSDNRNTFALQRKMIDSIRNVALPSSPKVTQRTPDEARANYPYLTATKAEIEAYLNGAQNMVPINGILADHEQLGAMLTQWNHGLTDAQTGVHNADFIDISLLWKRKQTDRGQLYQTERKFANDLPAITPVATPAQQPAEPEVNWRDLAINQHIEGDICFLGRDKEKGGLLKSGINKYITETPQGQQQKLPNFYSLHLFQQGIANSEQKNRDFITNLRCNYVKICNKDVVRALNKNNRPIEGPHFGTGHEVNILLDRRYRWDINTQILMSADVFSNPDPNIKERIKSDPPQVSAGGQPRIEEQQQRRGRGRGRQQQNREQRPRRAERPS